MKQRIFHKLQTKQCFINYKVKNIRDPKKIKDVLFMVKCVFIRICVVIMLKNINIILFNVSCLFMHHVYFILVFNYQL